MDKQTIQELDIIIKAQCESARKDLKKIAQETKSTATNISKSLDSINKSSTINNFQKSLEQGKRELTYFGKEIEKIKIDNNGLKFEINADMSDFDEQYEKALEEYKNKQIEIPIKLQEQEPFLTPVQQEIPNNNQSSNNNISNIEKVRNALKEAKKELGELRSEAAKIELKGLNPYEVLSFRESLKLLMDQAITTIPIINNLKTSFEQNLNGDFGDSLIQKGASAVVTLKNKINELSKNIVQEMSNIKSHFTQAFDKVAEPIISKLNPIKSIFSEIAKLGNGTFNKVKDGISKMGDTIGKPINKLKQLTSYLKGIKNKSNESSFTNNFGKSLESGIKSIKKFAMSLLSIRTAFTAISKASNAYLSFDTQLSDSIQNSWNVLGSLLAPTLEYVASLFNKLVSSVASFVKALTGIDLVAKANAKALDKQSKSAQQASKSLSGIDDIDTLSSGSGTENNQTITANIDITPFENFIDKVKEIFSTIFEPLQLAWENVGTSVFESISEMISNIGELGSSVGSSLLEVWNNGTGQEIIENLLLGFKQVFDVIGNISTALKNAWNNANSGTSIIQNIANYFKNIQSFCLSIGDSINKWVLSESFQEALNRVFTFISDIFGIIKEISDWILKMYDIYVKPVVEEKILPAIDSIIIAVSDIWNAVKPVIDFVIAGIKNNLEPAIDGLCRFIGGIIDAIKGIATFISGVFTGNWKKAWNGIKEIFKGIWDSMSSLITTPINTLLAGVEFLVNKIISGFNSFKKALNKISFDIPSWIPVIGGKKWGFDLKMSDEISLPRLAKGNVAYEPTQAIFGEYANARSNPEITSPVNLMKDSFRDVLSEFDFNGTRIDTLKIDVAGDNFYQGAIDYINNETIRKGVNVIKEAY